MPVFILAEAIASADCMSKIDIALQQDAQRSVATQSSTNVHAHTLHGAVAFAH